MARHAVLTGIDRHSLALGGRQSQGRCKHSAVSDLSLAALMRIDAEPSIFVLIEDV